MELNSRQRDFLRKKAHKLDAVVRIGKDGLTDTIISSILDAIKPRELIKVKILQNCEVDKKDIYSQLLEIKDFEVVGMIGRTIIIYKENKDKPSISIELKTV